MIGSGGAVDCPEARLCTNCYNEATWGPFTLKPTNHQSVTYKIEPVFWTRDDFAILVLPDYHTITSAERITFRSWFWDWNNPYRDHHQAHAPLFSDGKLGLLAAYAVHPSEIVRYALAEYTQNSESGIDVAAPPPDGWGWTTDQVQWADESGRASNLQCLVSDWDDLASWVEMNLQNWGDSIKGTWKWRDERHLTGAVVADLDKLYPDLQDMIVEEDHTAGENTESKLEPLIVKSIKRVVKEKGCKLWTN